MIEPITLSVVIPAHNEGANLPALIDEIDSAFRNRMDIEIIVVDDASSDQTVAALESLKRGPASLRVLRHSRQSGQSAALISGVRAARGQWIGTLDGDGQNDPADLPRMLAEIERRNDPSLKLIQGWRVSRRDNAIKRWSSRIANAVRATLLRDATPDSGCGIRLVEREALLRVPAFNHMHRFIPALLNQAGWTVVSLPVSHRPRRSGRSHYGLFGRLAAGIVDLCGVAWLGRRALNVQAQQLPDAGDQP